MTALQGIRILDFTRVLAGPFCTMLLADFGAEVIKVERPGVGDDTRQWGPPWAGRPENRMSAYYLSVNRNKRSLTLNLATSEGCELARRLALSSDVLIENFKAGQMQGYGLDDESLRPHHPGLIYASITGYGQTSPYADRPGYDYVIQAQSGLMSITGPAEGEPYKVGVAISDVITGLFAANAIQAALRHRERTGAGQYIDVSLLDSQLAALVNVASNYLVSGAVPPRFGNEHPNIVPYQVFQAADRPLVVNVGNDRQFRQFCAVIGQPALADDARFATNPARVMHRETLIPVLEGVLVQRPAAEWTQALLDAGVPVGEINTIPDILSDPHAQARGLVQDVTLADGTATTLLGSPLHLSATPPALHRPPPLLGQDTDAILRDVLGLADAEIATYREKGVV